jgi:hypothetical protein
MIMGEELTVLELFPVMGFYISDFQVQDPATTVP